MHVLLYPCHISVFFYVSVSGKQEQRAKKKGAERERKNPVPLTLSSFRFWGLFTDINYGFGHGNGVSSMICHICFAKVVAVFFFFVHVSINDSSTRFGLCTWILMMYGLCMMPSLHSFQ